MKTLILTVLATVLFLAVMLLNRTSVQAHLRHAGRIAHDAVFGFMARTGLVLGALVYSTEQTTLNGPMYGLNPATRVKANRLGGRIRVATFTYTAPASPPAIGDKIVWGKLPIKCRPLGYLGRLEWSVGQASCTLNLGDSVTAARHLAATSVTTAGSATPSAAGANGAIFETSDDSNSFANAFSSTTDDCTLISTVAGAALVAGQVVTLTMPYVQD